MVALKFWLPEDDFLTSVHCFWSSTGAAAVFVLTADGSVWRITVAQLNLKSEPHLHCPLLKSTFPQLNWFITWPSGPPIGVPKNLCSGLSDPSYVPGSGSSGNSWFLNFPSAGIPDSSLSFLFLKKNIPEGGNFSAVFWKCSRGLKGVIWI